MVSVIAVKIQFSSPRGVFLSFILPGMESTLDGSSKLARLSGLRWTNHRSAMGIGVVRQLVKRSAGNSGPIGSKSPGDVGQRTMVSLTVLAA